MISYLGDFKEDATVYIMFNTFSSDDPSASCTITNFINTDVHVHKDDGLTQRNNAAGITVSVDFDGITGSHMVKIDTSDDTVGGFWVVGHEYFVRIEGTTIDGATINSVIGQFSIENRFNEVDVVKWLGTAAATPTVAGVPEVDITHWVSGAIGPPTVAGVPEVDIIRIGGDSQSRIDFKDFVDAGYDPATNKVQGVVLVDTTTTNTDLVSAAAIVNEWETQSQADPTGFHVNVKEVNGTAQTANDNSADINAILGDTNELQTDWVNGGRLDLILDIIAADTTTDIPALIAALNNISTAQVNTECDTALTDYDSPTRAEATTDKDAIITEVNANETKIDTLQTDSTAIKAKTDNLPSGIAKNVALSNFQAYMVLSSDHVTAATGKTLTGTISKDGGAFASLTNAISEVSNGLYKVNLTQTEMNADVITLKFTETDCDQRVVVIHTT